MRWVEKRVPSYVYYETLVGELWSPTLQKTVEDFPWGHVCKRKSSERYVAWDSVALNNIGAFYHKTSAKKALVATVVERVLNR